MDEKAFEKAMPMLQYCIAELCARDTLEMPPDMRDSALEFIEECEYIARMFGNL